MTAFLHGIETQYLNAGGVPIFDTPTTIIGIVGTAPKGAVNEVTLITSDTQAAEVFGIRKSGYTLAYAFDAIYDHGGALMLVVNVADKVAVVAPADRTFNNETERAMIGRQYVSAVTVTNAAATTTYSPVTDYTLDSDQGIITRLSTGTIPKGGTVRVGYSFIDPSLVVPADIVGGVSVTGKRTGLHALLNASAKYGLSPTLVIAPGFSPLSSVSSEMNAIADRLQAERYIDASIGATFDQVLAGRASGAAPVSNFNTANLRALLCYPHLKRFDVDTGAEALEPYSQRAAGLRAQTDRRFGFWYSLSNKEIQGVVGVERELTTSFDDPLSQNQILNSRGIFTYLQVEGGGLRSWGNRSAAFPSITTPDNFLVIQRVRDIIAKGIRRASLQFIDLPINGGLIDAIRVSILAYFQEKTVQGALLPGSQCLFLPGDNPASAIAKGQLIFTTVVFPPPPLEKIVDKQVLDISLAASLIRA